MAWNGSAQPSGKATARSSGGRNSKPSSSARSKFKAVVGVLLLLSVVGGVVVFVLNSKEETVPEAKPVVTKPVAVGKTGETRLHYPTQTESVAPEEPVSLRTNRWGEVVKRKKPETYTDEAGVLRYKVGNARVPNPDDFKNPIRISHEGCMHEFSHPVENEIALLISIQPGEPLVGEPDYENMKQDFANALLDKIEIGDDDSDVDRELKKNVAEIKQQLAERVKNGEDLIEIMKDARRELRQSAEYKQQLTDLVQEQLYDPYIPDEDLKSAFDAANRMLEEKGIEPIKETRFLRARNRILRVQEQRNAAEAARQNQ